MGVSDTACRTCSQHLALKSPPLHILGNAAHFVQRPRLTEVLQQVKNVVHFVDQPMDLPTVNLRDEGAVWQAIDYDGDVSAW